MSDALFLICFSFSIVWRLLLRFPKHAWHTKDGLGRKPWAGHGGLAWPGLPPGTLSLLGAALGRDCPAVFSGAWHQQRTGLLRLPQGCLADVAQDLGIADRGAFVPPQPGCGPVGGPHGLHSWIWLASPCHPRSRSVVPSHFLLGKEHGWLGLLILDEGGGGARPAGSREPAQGAREARAPSVPTVILCTGRMDCETNVSTIPVLRITKIKSDSFLELSSVPCVGFVTRRGVGCRERT